MENKTFDQMNLLDSFLFGTTLGYEEYGKEVSGIILRKELEEVLAMLKPRECEIMRLRFGFDGPSLTLEEVGQVFDVTRERIRQIEHKCIRKLRHPSKAKRIKDFYC